MAMFTWWKVVPDRQRQQWVLDPFVSVGPLRFGASPDEVTEALEDATAERQRHTLHRAAGGTVSTVVEGRYQKFGLRLYYREERLAGVAVDALCGPQVLADGVALVGRVPSEVEQWMLDRAEAHEPDGSLSYLDAGVPDSASLGVVVDVQRAGDHLLTKPVFVPREALHDLPHFLPRDAWFAH